MRCPICEDIIEPKIERILIYKDIPNGVSITQTDFSNVKYQCNDCNIKWKITIEHVEDDDKK